LTGDSTKSVHEAEPIDEQTGSIITPIYETSTFGFRKAEDVPKAVAGERWFYTRWENPTVVRLEKKLAAFEHGGDGAAFSSGMAAISTSVFSFLRKGAHVLGIRDLYGGTFALMHEVLPNLGIGVDLVDTTDFGAMEMGIRKNTRIVYIESPTNPTMKLVDIARTAKLAHKYGAMLLIDSTWGNARPPPGLAGAERDEDDGRPRQAAKQQRQGPG
jgi:methionine-gamma-lyase